MKYSPKINDQLIGVPQLTEMHPHQDPADAQGVLETSVPHFSELFSYMHGLNAPSDGLLCKAPGQAVLLAAAKAGSAKS